MKGIIHENFILVVLKVILSIALFLLGIWINSYIVDNYMVSYLNIVVLALCLFFLTSLLDLNKYVRKRYIWLFIFAICVLTAICIFFSSNSLFREYLNGHSSEISPHWEHNWAHDTIVYVANSLMDNASLVEILSNNFIDIQYIVTFFYSSLLFITGGDVVTNWCVWNGFHLAITAILVLHIAIKMGIEDKKQLAMILVGSIIMPAFDVLYIYDRDIIGEFFLIFGFYIYFFAYKKGPRYCLLLFPIYGFFFFALRVQYVMIAAVLCISAYLSNINRSGYMLLIAITIPLGILLIYSTGLWTSLNFEFYVNKTMEGNRGLVSTLLVGLIGYFPWTNLMTDEHASYHFFLCLQAAVDLVLWFYFYLAFRTKFRQCLYNPIALGSIMLLSFGFIGGAGHIKYFCISAPLFLILIGNIGLKRLIRSYIIVIICYTILSLVYDTLRF